MSTERIYPVTLEGVGVGLVGTSHYILVAVQNQTWETQVVLAFPRQEAKSLVLNVTSRIEDMDNWLRENTHNWN